MEKNKPESYYLLANDIYFKKIDKNTSINREVYTTARKSIKPHQVIKYSNFILKDEYTIKQIYELVQTLKRYTSIIITIFNPKLKEIFLLFYSNRESSLLEQNIREIVELEV